MSSQKIIEVENQVMPQNFNAFDGFKVKENVKLIMRIYRLKEDTKEHLRSLDKIVRNRKFLALSGG